jgi:hypothetical protein
MGITDENAEQVVMTYRTKVEELRHKITEIDELQVELVEKFTKEYYERLANAKTPEQSAQDFALLNWLLDEKVEQVSTMEAQAEVVSSVIDLDYLQTQIEIFKMALEDEKDQEQIDYLTTTLEMFEMAIEEAAAQPAIPAEVGNANKPNVKITLKTEPIPVFREGGVITGTGALSSYVDLVNEKLMTEAEFVTFMREKGYKVMPKSVYNEIKGVDDYDFMIKILGYNNLI